MVEPIFKKYAHVVAVYDSRDLLLYYKTYNSAEQAYCEALDIYYNPHDFAEQNELYDDIRLVCRYHDGYIMSMNKI